MSVLLSDSEIVDFSSAMNDHWDEFSRRHSLVVIKQPIETINLSSEVYAGYGSASSDNTVTLTPVSGIFPCMTYEPEKYLDKLFNPIPNWIGKGSIIIKTKLDAQAFIDLRKTEYFILDNKTFTMAGGPLFKSYGNLTFAYYSLEKTT